MARQELDLPNRTSDDFYETVDVETLARHYTGVDDLIVISLA